MRVCAWDTQLGPVRVYVWEIIYAVYSKYFLLACYLSFNLAYSLLP